MTEERQQSVTFPASVLIALIVAAGGVALIDRGFESTRPPEGVESFIHDSEMQAVDARLWEDPLQAIQEIRSQEAKNFREDPKYVIGTYAENNSAIKSQDALSEWISNGGSGSCAQSSRSACATTVIATLLPDSPYALSAERRRRIRYAVVAALSEEFLPQEPERIGVAKVSIEPEPDSNGSPHLLAFESFESEFSADRRRVVILWIPQRMVSKTPLGSVQALLQELIPSELGFGTVLLGPPDSNGLAAMYKELMTYGAPVDERLAGVLRSQPQMNEEAKRRTASIVTAAAQYLDDGFPPTADLGYLVTCVNGTQTQTGVADCLARMAIPDSDSEWHGTVAESWFADNGFNPPRVALDPSAQALRESIHDYLDVGLRDDQMTVEALAGCLTTEPWAAPAFASCLQSIGGGIQDSDSTWYETIAQRYGTMLRHQHIASELDASPRQVDPDRTGSILLAADNYLDLGVPLTASLEKGITCLANVEESAEAIGECLTLLNLQDSDRDWHRSVAEYWWRINVSDRDYIPSPLQVTEPPRPRYFTGITEEIDRAFADAVNGGGGPSDMAECLAIARSQADADRCLGSASDLTAQQLSRIGSVVRAATEYLDEGIRTPGAVRPLVGCLVRSPLSTDLISGCLLDLGLSDSDENWHETVAGSWWRSNTLELPTITQVVDQLRADLDAYLDDEQQQSSAQLTQCVNLAADDEDPESQLASCLGPMVEGSDAEDWLEFVVYRTALETRRLQLGERVESLLSDEPDAWERVKSVLSTADSYLDNGIPSTVGIEPAVRCLADDARNEALAGCLGLIDVSDSDSDWVLTVAERSSRTRDAVPSYYEWKEQVLPAASNEAWGYRPSYDRWKRELDPARAQHYSAFTTRLEAMLPPKSSALERVGSVLAATLSAADTADEPAASWMDVEGLSSNLSTIVPCLRVARIEIPEIQRCFRGSLDEGLASEVARSWHTANDRPASWWNRNLVVFSPQATIPTTILRYQYLLPEEVPRATDLNANIIVPSLSDDSFVAKALYDELTSRRIDKSDPIALVYEHDTRYGRALQQLLDCDSPHWSSPADESAPCFDNIETYGYLRGLDGVGPADPSAGDDADSGDPGLISSDPGQPLERPMGSHQFDYLRRLADQIAEGHPVAIGILGTDIFDKRLILQGLRDESPGALFFTTDVDAALENSDEYRVMRNLVVASSHGFSHTVCPDPAGERAATQSPPFRDNYQTSYFFATCAAAGINGMTALSPQIFASDVDVYEVGRKGLVNLTDPLRNARGTSLRDFVVDGLVWLALLLPLLVLTFVSLARWKMRDPAARNAAQVGGLYGWGAILGLGALAALGLLFLVEHLMGAGEPFDIAVGVSARPAIILQGSAIAIALFFLLFARHRVAASNAEIEEKYGLAESEQTPATEPRNVWAKHRHALQYRRPKLRLAWLVASAIGLIAYLVLTPRPPLVRGAFSWGYGDLPMTLVVIALLLVMALTVDCADHLFRCRTFVRQLARDDLRFALPADSISSQPFARSPTLWSAVAAIELIAARTETISSLPVLLFVLLSLMAFSGSGIFEGWQWSWALTAVYVTICGVLVVAAFLLQREAERSRGRIIARLRLASSSVVNHAGVAGDSPNEKREQLRKRQIDSAIEHIVSIRRGAFVDWFRHPLLQAILLPSTAPALILALQNLLS